ncbi:MAG: D-lyxose/D-mannose family sugar isomerase [Promethearchaeota archaeon]
MVLSKQEVDSARERAKEFLDRAGIVITDDERAQMEVLDFNLGRHAEMGLQIVVYVNTERVCAKELVLFPQQTCIEHLHPARVDADGTRHPGKEETFRCRWGEVYLYVPGPPPTGEDGKPRPTRARVPQGKEDYFTVFHEVHLTPGEQYTLAPETLHWFQAGPEGAVVSEFSTTSTDELDVFTDPECLR